MTGAILTTLLLGLAGGSACSDDGHAPTPDAWVACSGGTDLDGDGYGPGCAMGEDCDDSVRGIWGPCVPGSCPSGWVLVPEGPFTMGCDPESAPFFCSADEQPAHTVLLSEPFCVQETEVTVGAFRACVEAGVCTERPETTREGFGETCNYTATAGARERQPVNCVSKAAAEAFCQAWVGGDLPTEAQWEKAARGTDGRSYPWGDEEPTCDRANFDVDGREVLDQLETCRSGCGVGCARADPSESVTWEVGSAPGGASPFGALDLSGNVQEWVLDCYSPDAYATCDASASCQDPFSPCDAADDAFVSRGGDIRNAAPFELSVVFRQYNLEHMSDSSIGFRCVRAVPLQ